MTNKLKWVAVNGVKPDLPDGVMVKRIWYDADGEIDDSFKFVRANKLDNWINVICYAIEPVDPVRELVEAARHSLDALYTHDDILRSKDRLGAAIKAVEEMK